MDPAGRLTVWDTVTQMSVAAYVMLAILLIAIQIVLVITPLKWRQLRRLRRAQEAFEQALGRSAVPGEVQAIAMAHGSAPGARVLTTMLTLASSEHVGYEELLGEARRAIAREQESLEHLMPTLASIAATAPLMGLFGTVWGLIEAFLTISAERSSQLHIIAPAMSGALLTTALGLISAMPASVVHNYAGARVQAWLEELDALAQRWAGRLAQPSPPGQVR